MLGGLVTLGHSLAGGVGAAQRECWQALSSLVGAVAVPLAWVEPVVG